jgi:crotonobetainyl-CoA:carnitine CoA-transferase CaiB-like acyl-CoA transferase
MLPLAGLRVVDGATFYAGPMVSSLMADYGADVIRVEPPTADPYRTDSLSFLAVNQRKRGVVLDLKHPDDVTSGVWIKN